MKDLVSNYRTLINETLPATYQFPVRFNHCFNRIVLDWLFSDCWYDHLDRQTTAVSQLNETQLEHAIQRMNLWLENHDLLIEDNFNSLRWRKKRNKINQMK